jgi:hypothetical protein
MKPARQIKTLKEWLKRYEQGTIDIQFWEAEDRLLIKVKQRLFSLTKVGLVFKIPYKLLKQIPIETEHPANNNIGSLAISLAQHFRCANEVSEVGAYPEIKLVSTKPFEWEMFGRIFGEYHREYANWPNYGYHPEQS